MCLDAFQYQVSQRCDSAVILATPLLSFVFVLSLQLLTIHHQREYVEKSFLMVLRLHKKSGVMLAAHLLLLFEKQQEGLLDKAREYTDRVPTSRKVWEARGKIVKTISGESSVEAAEIKRVLLADRTWDS